MSETITVGIAEGNICRIPDKIGTIALGSCVGVILYSHFSDYCGMIHVMMPYNTKNDSRVYKYADSGIDTLLDALRAKGLRKSSIKAKICGGAEMFKLPGNTNLSIGSMNIDAVKETLKKHHIEITAEDLGGTLSRTVVFDPSTRKAEIKIPGGERYYI